MRRLAKSACSKYLEICIIFLCQDFVLSIANHNTYYLEQADGLEQRVLSLYTVSRCPGSLTLLGKLGTFTGLTVGSCQDAGLGTG